MALPPAPAAAARCGCQRLPTPANATNAANPASNAEICEHRDLRALPSNTKQRQGMPSNAEPANAENCDVT